MVALVGETTLQLLPEVLVCSGMNPPGGFLPFFHRIYHIDFIFVSSHIHGPFFESKIMLLAFSFSKHIRRPILASLLLLWVLHRQYFWKKKKKMTHSCCKSWLGGARGPGGARVLGSLFQVADRLTVEVAMLSSDASPHPTKKKGKRASAFFRCLSVRSKNFQGYFWVICSLPPLWSHVSFLCKLQTHRRPRGAALRLK